MALPFAHIIGNDTIKKYLKLMVHKGVIGNSLLFAGPDGIGKSLFAQAFAKLIFPENAALLDSGNHPDVHVYRPEGKIGMHSIETMRQFSSEVYLAPYESPRKIFIIHDADRMLSYSANALLKTFEEPSLDTIIILLSSTPERLLPTVLSRCRRVYFHPVAQEEIARLLVERKKLSPEKAAHIAVRSQGSVGQALRLADAQTSTPQTQLLRLLNEANGLSYGDLLHKIKEIGQSIDQSKEALHEEVNSKMKESFGDDMSATQRQQLEKEIEGAVTMKHVSEAHHLFEVFLSWYRDLELLQTNGNTAYLMNPDVKNELEQRLQRGSIPSIDRVQESIVDARLALERSTSLTICLENLFLRY